MMLMKRKHYPLAFAERNKIVIAVVGLIVLALAFYVTFNAESLPVVGGGKVVKAYFAESGGLKKGNEVRVAGVKVGKVTGIALDGAQVVVSFRIKGVSLGDQTTAAVDVKTLLGQKYLALDPAGTRPLDGAIQEDHTTTPYDVNAALSDLSTDIGQIDTGQLEKSLDTLADAFKDTPASVRSMVSGLTALSRTISTRDTQLADLFKKTSSVTSTIAGDDDQLAQIVDDGNALMQELTTRRDAVKELLQGTASLASQVSGLVHDNERQLTPALQKLDKVSTILQQNQDNLDQAVKEIGPYYRMLTSALGNGPWVDAYLCGLFDDKDAPVLDNDAVRNCHPGGAQ
jgi:phospholipid/cholesterol/gamma-HCH transport system substrate-binding protein